MPQGSSAVRPTNDLYLLPLYMCIIAICVRTISLLKKDNPFSWAIKFFSLFKIITFEVTVINIADPKCFSEFIVKYSAVEEDISWKQVEMEVTN